MPVKVSPERFAEKHARNLQAATQDIKEGVDRVSESPTAKAADQQEKMLRKLTEAVNSGKWGRGLRRVSLDEWKTRMRDVGVGRIAAGIEAAHDKQVEFARQLFEHENRLLQDVEGMPDLTLEDSVNRASTWIRGMAEFTRE